MLQHIENRASERIPKIPFAKIANFTLGRGYDLSLVFVDHKTSRELNKKYRDKNKPTNILSFPLSRSEGEILIDIRLVRQEALDLARDYKEYLTYIFIHGLAHLKGFDHGSKMEAEEARINKKFSEK